MDRTRLHLNIPPQLSEHGVTQFLEVHPLHPNQLYQHSGAAVVRKDKRSKARGLRSLGRETPYPLGGLLGMKRVAWGSPGGLRRRQNFLGPSRHPRGRTSGFTQDPEDMFLVRPKLVIRGHSHRQHEGVALLVTRRGHHDSATDLCGGREAHGQVSPNPRPVGIRGQSSHLGHHALTEGFARAAHGDAGTDLRFEMGLLGAVAT